MAQSTSRPKSNEFVFAKNSGNKFCSRCAKAVEKNPKIILVDGLLHKNTHSS